MSYRDSLVASARSFIGVRFAHQGRSRAQGLDCLGLVIASAAQAGITLEGFCPTALDERMYGTRPDTDYLQAKLDRYLEPVAIAQPGDLLLLNIVGRPQHLAMVSDYPVEGELGMIHSYALARKVVEHRLDQLWRREIRQAYALPRIQS